MLWLTETWSYKIYMHLSTNAVKLEESCNIYLLEENKRQNEFCAVETHVYIYSSDSALRQIKSSKWPMWTLLCLCVIESERRQSFYPSWMCSSVSPHSPLKVHLTPLSPWIIWERSLPSNAQKEHPRLAVKRLAILRINIKKWDIGIRVWWWHCTIRLKM